MIGVPIAKALNPLDAGDFVTICVRLSASLRGAVAGTEGAAMRSALEKLDVDWPELTDSGRRKIIAAAKAEIKGLQSTVPEVVAPVFSKSAETLVSRSRTATVARYAFGKQLRTESTLDRQVIDNLPKNQSVYIKDQYGRRADALDHIAKDVVSSGLERGLGRDDISEELSERLAQAGVTRTDSYWNLVGSDFANKARTASQLNTFERAEIQVFVFDAILDEITSEICRLLHGREFSVSAAAERTRRGISLEDPEEIKALRPWVQSGTDGDGNHILYFDRGRGREVVAEVKSFGEGQKDKIGSYTNVMSNKAMEGAGIPIPPCHGDCRSTIAAL